MHVAAMGIWSTWTLSQTKVGDNFILADVSIRVKYFFIVTFCLNALCASPCMSTSWHLTANLGLTKGLSLGLICWKIWRITSRVASYTSTDRTTSRILEVVIESGTSLLASYLPRSASLR